VTARPPTIVASGGGGFLGEPGNTLLDDLILARTGLVHPRVCFLPTAGGDDRWAVTHFFDTLVSRAQPSWLPLFDRRDADLRAVLLEQDVIYVGGGNTANMLAIWRAQGVDAVLREAWQRGVVLAGVSAGALCWFERGVTDSFGPQLEPLDGLLGFLAGSFCPHYDTEALRRPRLHELIAAERLPETLACDDGAALVFEGTTLREAVASRPAARAYRVELVAGSVRETELPTRYLG
jgi:dipeptidase E